MRILIEQWRAEGHKLRDRDERGITLLECADELEKACHDEFHGSYFHEGCPICDKEMREQ